LAVWPLVSGEPNVSSGHTFQRLDPGSQLDFSCVGEYAASMLAFTTTVLEADV
jgi:hypothetical protein